MSDSLPFSEVSFLGTTEAPTEENGGTVHSCTRFVAMMACGTGAIVVTVLIGWLFDIRLLKSLGPSFPTMKANAALCLGCLAAALFLSRTEQCREKHSLPVVALVSLVFVIAGLTSCEYLFGWNLGIDQLLFRDLDHPGTDYVPGRCAPGACVCFLLLCGSLALIDSWPRLSIALTLASSLAELIALIGYLYNLPTLYGAGHHTSLALPAIIAFLLLCGGVLFARPNRGLPGLFTASWTEGHHVHALLLGAICLPVMLGSLAMTGQRAGWYGREFTLAFSTVLLIALSVALVWATGEDRRRVEIKRIRAERALRESGDRFRMMANNIPNLVWMAHANGDIYWYNRRWYEYTGKTLEQMQGWGWESVHDPEILPLVRERWTAALANGTSFEMVFPLRGADGVFRSFLTRVQPVKGESGKVAQWFGTNTDISAERNALEDLRKANRELEEYAYVSSHDLQEPLRMVNIFTQLLMRDLQDKLDDTTREHAQVIREGVERMQQLIQDLLQFSRAVNSDRREDANRCEADLNICYERALSTLATRVNESHAELIVARLPRVRGEEAQLTQVFQNLLSNALKYRNPNQPPRIEVSVDGHEEEWIVHVQDNGIGFEPQYAERIFGLFKRLHKEEYPGTGLGLAICQRVVERYGGRIWAEGELGKGANFHFSLPKVKLDEVAKEPAVEAA